MEETQFCNCKININKSTVQIQWTRCDGCWKQHRQSFVQSLAERNWLKLCELRMEAYSGGHGCSLQCLYLSSGLGCDSQYFGLTTAHVSFRTHAATDRLTPTGGTYKSIIIGRAGCFWNWNNCKRFPDHRRLYEAPTIHRETEGFLSLSLGTWVILCPVSSTWLCHTMVCINCRLLTTSSYTRFQF